MNYLEQSIDNIRRILRSASREHVKNYAVHREFGRFGGNSRFEEGIGQDID